MLAYALLLGLFAQVDFELTPPSRAVGHADEIYVIRLSQGAGARPEEAEVVRTLAGPERTSLRLYGIPSLPNERPVEVIVFRKDGRFIDQWGDASGLGAYERTGTPMMPGLLDRHVAYIETYLALRADPSGEHFAKALRNEDVGSRGAALLLLGAVPFHSEAGAAWDLVGEALVDVIPRETVTYGERGWAWRIGILQRVLYRSRKWREKEGLGPAEWWKDAARILVSAMSLQPDRDFEVRCGLARLTAPGLSCRGPKQLVVERLQARVGKVRWPKQPPWYAPERGKLIGTTVLPADPADTLMDHEVR